MNAYINWMAQRPKLNTLLIVLYYIAVVAPHKRFGTFLNEVVFNGITRDQYNLYVLIIALSVLGIYGALFLRKSMQTPDKNKLWGYMVLNIFLATIIINYLFVINIEVIHFPQYAAFAILIFPMLRNYNATLIWTTIAGGVDEAYQNFYLAPVDTGYYDWNDVLTNLVGGVFGLLLIRSFQIENQPYKTWYKSSAIYGFLSICGLVFILWLTGFLSIYPADSSTIQLVSKELTGFWQTVHPNVTFHVVEPLEGIVLTVLLWCVYSRIGT